jgi:acetylornithine deacetylase
MNLEKLLSHLVSIPSPSGQEKAIADFVCELVGSWGLDVQRIENNVWFTVGQGGPRLLMLSHLDTVPLCEGWHSDPWKPEWNKGSLAGLGANEAKGCVAAMLWTAKTLASSRVDGTVVFALAAEEETGGPSGMAKLLPSLGKLDAAIVGEPTGLQPCIAQRGMLLLSCTAKGESGHVAHATQSDNAILKAGRDIARVSEMTFPPDNLLGATRAHVTLIRGGGTLNQVPDSCEFIVDLRTTPNLDHQELAERISKELESRVTIHTANYLPKSTDPRSPIAVAALAASGRSAFVGSAATSDWAFLGDLPTVKIGPGDTHRSHRPNEFITSKELHAGARIYQNAVERFMAHFAAKGVTRVG